MRVAFVSFHCRYHYQTIAGPFLQAAVAKHQPDVEWRSFEFLTSSPVSNALSDLLDYQPDVVAFSSYLWSLDIQGQLAARLKLVLPNAKRIMGGPESWLALEEPDHPLLTPFDVIVLGEAENEFPVLLDRIGRDETPEHIIRAEPIENLDKLPSPYQMGLFRDDAPYLHMETSRGCVNRCTFCTSAYSPTRLYSVDRWRDDLDAVLNRFENLHRINLLDRSFNEHTDRMVSIIDGFFEKSNSQILHIEMHPDFIDDDQLNYLKSLPSNRLHIEMGIQSFDKRTLAHVGRKTDPEHVERLVKTFAGFDSVSLHVDLIAGLPKQKQSDIRDSVETLCALQPDDIQLERLKMLPGTIIRKSLNHSIVYAPTPPWEVLKTDDYSASELFESDRLSRLLDRFYNSAYFSRTLRKMASELGSWNRLWDLLGEKEDRENPSSVFQRFRYLEAIIDEHNLSNRVREQWRFDLFLHGRYRLASQLALEPEYNRRLVPILRAQSHKGKGHIELFDNPIEDLPSFKTPGLLLFLHQPKRVLLFEVDDSSKAIQVDLLAISTRGKLEKV